MGMGKYYCDYCEKQFQDTPFARKRHLQSASHQRSKALWFDSFKLPIQIHHRPCNRFLTTGFCQFGDSCQYFHPILNNRQGFPSLEQGTSFTGISMGSSWGNIPPSLIPPPESGYPPLPFIDWA